MVEGRMQTRSWDDAATSTKKYRTEVIADRVQFGGGNSGGSSAPRTSGAPSSASQAPAQQEDELDSIEYPDEQINAEDIPF